jgi:hypothetical protein
MALTAWAYFKRSLINYIPLLIPTKRSSAFGPGIRCQTFTVKEKDWSIERAVKGEGTSNAQIHTTRVSLLLYSKSPTLCAFMMLSSLPV